MTITEFIAILESEFVPAYPGLNLTSATIRLWHNDLAAYSQRDVCEGVKRLRTQHQSWFPTNNLAAALMPLLNQILLDRAIQREQMEQTKRIAEEREMIRKRTPEQAAKVRELFAGVKQKFSLEKNS